MNGSRGYSQEALRRLETGTYRGRKQQYRTSEDQVKAIPKKVPALEGMTRSPSFDQTGHVDTANARRKYEQRTNYKPIGRGLDSKDADTLYKIFDRNRLSSGGNKAITRQLKNNIWLNTSDWENKYGKSVEQIVDDYSKDYERIAERKNAEKGNKNKVSTTFGNIFRGGTVEPALDLESTILGQIAPDTELTKAVRNATEKYSKQKAQTKAGVTSDMSDVGKGFYDVATNLAERGLEYLNPSAIKYGLQFGKTAENKRQQLKERGIEGKLAEVQSGITGLADAALDYAGFEALPALKGLRESGNIGKMLAGGAAVGGGEQALTSLIDLATDRIFNRDQSINAANVRNYMAQGLSKEEAEKQAFWDDVKQVAIETGSGAAFGALIQLPKAAKTSLDNFARRYYADHYIIDPDDPILNDAVDTSDLNEYAQDLLPQNSVPMLTDGRVNTALEGQRYPGLPERQLPAIQLPGTNGTIELPDLTGQSTHTVRNAVRTAAESTPQNPRIVKSIEEVQQALKEQRKAIREQGKKYKEATNKKTKKAEYLKYKEMQKELPQMQNKIRDLERQANGLAPISDRAKEAFDSYKEDLRKVGNMYAGENGKTLAKEAIDALEKYERTGVNSDFWDMANKVIALKEAATESYTSQAGNTSTYNTWFNEEDGGDLMQRILPPDNDRPPSIMWQAIGEALTTKKPEVAATSAPTSNIDVPHQIAERYASSFQDFDTYDYMDNVQEMDGIIERMADDISTGKDLTPYIAALEDNMYNAPDESTAGEMQALIDELTALQNGSDNALSSVERAALQEVDPSNVIYHAGTLSRLNKADSAGKMEGTRDTGYYGTGHYFVDTAHKANIGKGSGYGNKPFTSVDISKYNNLYRADTDAKASELHDFSQKMMRFVNKRNDRYYSEDGEINPERLNDYMDELYSSYKKLFGNKAMPRDEFETRLNQFRDEYEYDFYDRGDSAFTTFMKEHGYNGVDTRGTNSANTERGIVIYDLDEDSILQSNVTDEDIKNGLMNTRVRNGQPLFDEETDARIQNEIDSFNKRKAVRDEYRRLYDESRLQSLQKEIEQVEEELNNINEDALPYYRRILEDESFLRQEAENLNKEFRMFGLPGEDVDEIMASKRQTALESIAEADQYLAEDKAKLAELQEAYAAEEAMSKAAYDQARANIEGTNAPVMVNPDSVTNPNRPTSIGVVHDSKGRPRYFIQEKTSDNGTRPIEPGKTYGLEDEARQALRRAEKNNSIPMLTNTVDQAAETPNNGYWLRLLGDDNFLAQEAQQTGVEPEMLRQYAMANMGYADMPSQTPPPANDIPHMNGTMPGDNMRTSQTYTNTGKNAEGWTEEEYNKYTDPSQFQYESIDEEESVRRATDMRQREGREGFKERMMNANKASGAEIDGLMMEWRELGEEARALEAAGQDASDIWHESVRVFRKIQQLSTESAQGLQALAKWSRNTPEGMLADAENIINGKKKGEKNKLQEQLDKLAKQNKKVEFSESFVVQFLKEAGNLQGLDPDSREAREIMAKLGRMVNSQLPATFGEKLTSFLMDNMLGNFRTLITRNAGGNVGLNLAEQILQRPLAAGIDSLLSIKTGQRTQAGLTKEGLTEYIQGFAKGLKDEALDYSTGLHTSRTGQNTLGNAISSNRHVFKNKIMDRLDNLVKQGLSVGDRPFYEAVYNQTIGDYNRLRQRGVMSDDIQNLSAADFKLYSRAAAELNALAAVYQQDTTLSKALLGFKSAVGDLSRGILGVDILSQFSMPFVKTPANVIERAIDYSPLGGVRNAFRTHKERKSGTFDQNRFANETARNILGTALMGGGVALAANGLMSGSYSDDKDEKQAQRESGMQEYALNMGDKQMDIGWIPVVGSNNVAAAAAYDAFKNGEGNAFENAATGLKAGGQALFDQSMFQGLQRLFGTGETYNTDEGIVGNMANVVKQGLGQGIPSLFRQAGQVIDPYQRDVAYSNEGKSFGFLDNYDLNSLANNVPFLREQVLAPKVATTGELLKENQGRNIGSKILEDMILPGKVTKVEYSKLNEEAKRLKDDTTSADAYMPKATRKNVDTEEHTLTNKEWSDYEQRYYKELTEVGTKILDSDFYKDADSTTQVKTLKNAYDAVKSAINSEYNGKEIKGAAKKYVEAGGGSKGVDAVVKYYRQGAEAEELGVNANTYRKKEDEKAGSGKQYAEEKNNKSKGISTSYKVVGKGATTNQAVSEETKTSAKDLGLQTKTYNKIADKAGANAEKVYKAVPELQRNGLGTSSAYYTYADALKVDPNLSSSEFAKTFNAIDADNSKGIKQDELIDYFNQNKYSQQQADRMWKMYGDSTWKKVPALVNGSFVKK